MQRRSVVRSLLFLLVLFAVVAGLQSNVAHNVLAQQLLLGKKRIKIWYFVAVL